jgi:hypothetical protein
MWWHLFQSPVISAFVTTTIHWHRMPRRYLPTVAGVAIRLRQPAALGLDEKLFPHFREARPAIFAVKQVEYGGHDGAPAFEC